MLLTTLPVEIQERIYSCLPARDRVRFHVAMPKDSRFKNKNPATERRLGLFTKSIKKRKINTLSEPMMQYLGTIDRDDPTLDEIAEVFPDAVEKHRNSMIPKQSLADVIKDKTVTVEHIRACLSEDLSGKLRDNFDLKFALYNCTPQVFEIVILHPDILMFVVHHKFLISLLSYENQKLIMHLKQHGDRLGINIQTHARFVFDYIMKYECANTRYIIIALWYISFTTEELERMWIECLKQMNIHAVEAIDRIIAPQGI